VSTHEGRICRSSSLLTHGPTDIAYRTCRLLGYHSPRVGKPDDDAFDLELKRHAAFKAESWKEAIGLPLPCDEISFSARQPLLREAFDSEGHVELLEDGEAEADRTSYMAEIVKLLSLWYHNSFPAN
jgi:hypothetical protein